MSIVVGDINHTHKKNVEQTVITGGIGYFAQVGILITRSVWLRNKIVSKHPVGNSNIDKDLIEDAHGHTVRLKEGIQDIKIANDIECGSIHRW